MDECIFGHLHDWRHLECHVEYVHPERLPEPDPEILTKDTWYCTRCRKIETTTREE